jgi:hypothetical protein
VEILPFIHPTNHPPACSQYIYVEGERERERERESSECRISTSRLQEELHTATRIGLDIYTRWMDAVHVKLTSVGPLGCRFASPRSQHALSRQLVITCVEISFSRSSARSGHAASTTFDRRECVGREPARILRPEILHRVSEKIREHSNLL